jgi:hypothetical protein
MPDQTQAPHFIDGLYGKFVEAAGKRMARAYLEGGTRADQVVDEVAPPLFQSEDMRAAVAAWSSSGPAILATRSSFRDAKNLKPRQ